MSAKYKTKKILIKRRYQLLALILLILATGLVFLPQHDKHEGIKPELFVKNILSNERYISTDKLAERIISQDPSLILIDTRAEDAFNEFSLPNALNIPVDKVFDEDLNAYLDQDVYDIILFSNENFLADEVWMIGNRMGYQRLHVLKGGLNEWFKTIIHPKLPVQTQSQDAFDLHSFRMAAGRYFGVANDTLEIKQEVVRKPKPKKVVTKPKKKKKAPEGGC